MGFGMSRDLEQAKAALDSIINKSRVHFYKPIQLAEILFKHRTESKIDLKKIEDYRSVSKKWRDTITQPFLGRVCTSTAKFQDNLFENNAMPPRLLDVLGRFNKKNGGIVEAHIYKAFSDKYFQLNKGLDYCLNANRETFRLDEFMQLFWAEAGLKRSIDKVFEIVVYSLFEALVVNANLKIEINAQDRHQVLAEFPEFAQKVIGFDKSNSNLVLDAHFHRVGVTNAADRGLDIFANFGAVIQVKHLALSEEMAEGIISNIDAQKIVIVCKNAEAKTIESLLVQIGWRSRIQAIVTIEELNDWYERALTGRCHKILANSILNSLKEQIQLEFPSLGNLEFETFSKQRGYHQIQVDGWKSFS